MAAVGRSLLLTSYVGSVVLAGSAIRAAGSEAQKQALLSAIAAGDARPALAHLEPRSRYHLDHCATRAVPTGGAWRLSGRKSLVIAGPTATSFLVSAHACEGSSTAQGISLFHVDSRLPGLTRTDYRTIDGQSASDLALDDVLVGDHDVIGPPGSAMPSLELAFDAAAAAVCAEAVGAMDGALEITLAYLRGRIQFGRALSTNQALQHRLVDMHLAIEDARALSAHASNCIGLEPAARAVAVSAAKATVNEAARLVGQEAVQLHGAMGVTAECLVSGYFKRLTTVRMLLGDTDWHKRRFARLNAWSPDADHAE